jgi:hypothetical protein
MTYEVKDFILMTQIEDNSLCDDIIEFHKTCPNKEPGLSGASALDTIVKDSTDTTLQYNDVLFKRYLIELKKVVQVYENVFERCRFTSLYGIFEDVNVQHYKPPTQGFHAWHCERMHPNNDRHLVFMTYLNDVNDAGETEFLYQKFKVKPKKGLTLMWPVDWTYTHRGIASPTEDKYIVTGCLSFFSKELLSNE